MPINQQKLTPLFDADGLAHLEVQHFSRGVLPASVTTAQKIHLSQFATWDARASEAMTLDKPTDIISHIRSLMQRGRVQKAVLLLEAAIEMEQNDSAILPELYLEHARCRGYQGAWVEVLSNAELGLSSSPSRVTRLALFQCKALAFFELGFFQEATEQIGYVDSLSTTFPFAWHLLLYAKVIQVRILARDQGTEVASIALKEIWRKVQARATADDVLTLLRTEIDLARLAGKNYFNQAVGCLLLSESMGETLYSALARFDLKWSDANSRPKIATDLSSDLKEFERLKVQWNQLQSVELSSSLSAMKNEKTFAHDATPNISEIENLIVCNAQLKIDLSDRSTRHFPNGQNYFKALSILQNSKIEKEEFFRRYYELDQFSSERHDGALRNLFARIRKDLQVQIKSTSGTLTLPTSWVIS